MTRQGQPLRQALRRWLLAAFIMGAGPAALAQIDIAPLTVTRTVNWTGGDVSEQASFCVESFQEAPDKKSANSISYSLNVSIGGAATPFTLANGAGQTVPVTIAWTDVIAGSTTTLAPAVATPETQTGRLAGCPGGNNGLLTLTVLNASLGGMPAGTYSRTFAVEVTNSGSGRSRRTGNVTLSVVIPAIIRVSNINDLVLGTFNGVSNMVASDTICIYRNGGTLYGVTATGSGAAGAFTVANGASLAPYTVTWQDNVGTVALEAGVQAASRGNANTVSTTCGGGATDNATVTVTITAASLLGAMQPGLYSGVLTLMVIPQ